MSFIQAGVSKIDLLLAGFLRFSRLGRAALNLKKLDMNTMLSNIEQTIEFQIKQAGATLEVRTLPPCRGDAVQINQVFSNLIDNALKYRDPARGLRIAISGEEREGQSVYAVRDNGIGIAPEHQGKIFEMFHRLNPSATDGEGLGLAIAQKILERQEGRIWVESQAGEGSSFLFHCPQDKAYNMTMTKEVVILIADDDLGHVRLIEKNLERAGLHNQIERFENGQQILDFLFGRGPRVRAKEASYLMLLDIRMPQVDGVEVLRRVKSDPELRKIPTIMLTTTDDPREVEKCHTLGCSSYVVKPVDYDKFAEAIKQFGLFIALVQVPEVRAA